MTLVIIKHLHIYRHTTNNDTGARKWDWEWQGIDGNSPNSTILLVLTY